MKDLKTSGAPVRTKIDHEDIPRNMRLEYSYPASGKMSKVVDGIGAILKSSGDPTVDLSDLARTTAASLAKLFSLRTIAIGLRSADGKYRYEALVGYKAETEAATRKLWYTEEDFSEHAVYKGTSISKYTKVFLAEDNPWKEDEREAYNVPTLLGIRRRALDEYVEGDYIDIVVPGPRDELLGWIEIASTLAGKLPDTMTIRWLELVGRSLGTAISLRGTRT